MQIELMKIPTSFPRKDKKRQDANLLWGLLVRGKSRWRIVGTGIAVRIERRLVEERSRENGWNRNGKENSRRSG